MKILWNTKKRIKIDFIIILFQEVKYRIYLIFLIIYFAIIFNL